YEPRAGRSRQRSSAAGSSRRSSRSAGLPSSTRSVPRARGRSRSPTASRPGPWGRAGRSRAGGTGERPRSSKKARSSADRATGGEGDDQRAEGDAVDDEAAQGVGRQVAQEPGDRRVPGEEGEEGGDRRRAGRGAAVLADLAQLEESAQDHGGHREQERVARRRDAVEAPEQPGGDRRTRARDARDQGQRLGYADEEAVTRIHAGEVPPPRADTLGEQHYEGEGDQRRADQVEVAGARLDLVLEDEAEDRDRDRAEDDEPAEARLGAALPDGNAQLAQPRVGDVPEIRPEIEEDGGHRAELDHGREAGARVFPAEQRRHD